MSPRSTPRCSRRLWIRCSPPHCARTCCASWTARSGKSSARRSACGFSPARSAAMPAATPSMSPAITSPAVRPRSRSRSSVPTPFASASATAARSSPIWMSIRARRAPCNRPPSCGSAWRLEPRRPSPIRGSRCPASRAPYSKSPQVRCRVRRRTPTGSAPAPPGLPAIRQVGGRGAPLPTATAGFQRVALGTGSAPAALELGPRNLTVTPGTTVLVEVVIGHLNRLVTPFANPVVHTVSSASTSVDGRVVYVATSGEEAIALWITDGQGGESALSLTLAPRFVPPREIRLAVPGYRPKGGANAAAGTDAVQARFAPATGGEGFGAARYVEGIARRISGSHRTGARWQGRERVGGQGCPVHPRRCHPARRPLERSGRPDRSGGALPAHARTGADQARCDPAQPLSRRREGKLRDRRRLRRSGGGASLSAFRDLDLRASRAWRSDLGRCGWGGRRRRAWPKHEHQQQESRNELEQTHGCFSSLTIRERTVGRSGDGDTRT